MGVARVQRGLGGPMGFGETSLAQSDDFVWSPDSSTLFPDGLEVFGTRYDANQIYVATNGLISFGQAFSTYPQVAYLDPAVDIIAPFWADVDTRDDREGAESGMVWIDEGDTTLTVTWAGVGSYRYQADETNLFQLQLTDRGGGNFDLRMTYERIEWTSGSLSEDLGARMMLSSARLPEPWLPGGNASTLDSRVGNTGNVGEWLFEMREGAVSGQVPVTGQTRVGNTGNDVLTGGSGSDILRGRDGADILRGQAGQDWLRGGDGADTLNGASGDDFIFGGDSEADLRDVVYGGAGHDKIDGGYGNDLIYGGDGNDTIEGGFGVDDLIGQAGNDALSGAAWSDAIFGGDGADFLNGGFGYDRLNGGNGADRFFHLGIPDHGSDWVQDYRADQGDTLVWGGGATSPNDFQVNWADTAGAGVSGTAEAFVIYRPTGQIIWALVDGEDQDTLNLLISGTMYDILPG